MINVGGSAAPNGSSEGGYAPLGLPRPDTPHRSRTCARSLLNEGAVALVQGTEGLVGGRGRADLVVVPGAFGLRRLLDLEEVHGVDLAAVGPDAALAEHGIVGGQLLHLRDDLGAVVVLQCL